MQVALVCDALKLLIMNQSERVFRKRFYAVLIFSACVLLALTWAFIKGVLSQRGFTVAALIWSIAMSAAIFFLVRSRQRSVEDLRAKQIASGASAEAIDRDRCINSIRSLKRLIAVFAILLIYAVFATQGGPLLPRAVGAGFDALIVAACIYSLVRWQRRLRGLSAGDANESPKANQNSPG
jgi:peptidoglycan/LPS O-acetylase OafA/YrhL